MATLSALAIFAAAHHHVVSTRQLQALGWSEGGIRHLLHTQRVHRVHAGVFRVNVPELSREGRWLAAVLACSEHAALGFQSAAVLWDLLLYDARRPHVLVPMEKSGRAAPRPSSSIGRGR